MMGRSHAASGAALWLAAAPPIAAATGHPMDLYSIAGSTLVATGAALLPDFDHPQATLARTLGPITGAVAKIVGSLSGGHRKGTHSLLFVAAITALTAIATAWLPGLNAIIMFCLAYVAMMVLKLAPKKGKRMGDLVYVAQAALLTFLAVQALPMPWGWMPYAVGGGCLIHLIGDALTGKGGNDFGRLENSFKVAAGRVQAMAQGRPGEALRAEHKHGETMFCGHGVPWLYPFNKTHYGVVLLGTTGHFREKTLAYGFFALMAIYCAYATFQGFEWWSPLDRSPLLLAPLPGGDFSLTAKIDEWFASIL